jgi:hypothetical protein
MLIKHLIVNSIKIAGFYSYILTAVITKGTTFWGGRLFVFSGQQTVQAVSDALLAVTSSV